MPKNGSIPLRNKKEEASRNFCKNSPNFVAMATNPKSKNNVLYRESWRTGAAGGQKMKKQFVVFFCEKQTDRQTKSIC